MLGALSYVKPSYHPHHLRRLEPCKPDTADASARRSRASRHVSGVRPRQMRPLGVVSSKALSGRDADVDLTSTGGAVVVTICNRKKVIRRRRCKGAIDRWLTKGGVFRVRDRVEAAVGALSADLTSRRVEGLPSRVVDVPDAEADDTTVSGGGGDVRGERGEREGGYHFDSSG